MKTFRVVNQYRDLFALLLTTLISIVIFTNKHSEYTAAVQSDFMDVVSFILTPQRYYKNILSVKEENKKLSEQVVRLQLQNARFLNYKYQNEKLKEILQYSESNTISNLLPARVIRLGSASYVKSVLLDRGSIDIFVPGAKYVNLPVIDIYGLVGKTIFYKDKTSIVQLITDKNFSVSVRITDDDDNQALGNFYYAGENKGYLENIQQSLNIVPGLFVYTSGLSDIYPPDIVVAKTISKFVKDDRGKEIVLVDVVADINNLEYVFIVQ